MWQLSQPHSYSNGAAVMFAEGDTQATSDRALRLCPKASILMIISAAIFQIVNNIKNCIEHKQNKQVIQNFKAWTFEFELTNTASH